MNKAESKTWIDYHKSIFPAWGGWLTKQPTEGMAVLMAAWARAFAGTDLLDAKEASEQMLAGSIQKPFRDEDHVTNIIAASRAIRADRQALHFATKKRIDGQDTFQCPICLDDGVVVCWHPQYLAEVRAGVENPVPYDTAVLCTCSAGDSRSGSPFGTTRAAKINQYFRYDEKRCLRRGVRGVLYPPSKPEELDRIIEFVSVSDVVRSNKYAGDFA